MSTRLDPDELALLEEERDHLLGSLEDLDAEYAAGDMDEVDYLALKDDYTVRASEVLVAIEQQRSLMRRERPTSGRSRALLGAAGVLVFAVLAGVLVAQNAGQRGDGPITGAINTPRAQLATCQQASFQDPEGGIECYAGILADTPDNVEALTYQGWAFIRSDQLTEGARNLTRAVELDPDYADARVFRAVLAARAGDHELAAAEVDRFYRNSPSPVAVQVLQSQGLEREIFVQLLDDDTRACWQQAAQEGEAAEQFLSRLADCLDELLSTDPTNVDALVSRAYTSVDPADGDITEAVALAERAVAADPADPNAVLLRASLALAQERLGVVEADLATLAELPRPTASFLLSGPEQLEAALEAATTSTTTAPPTSVSPGDAESVVPNPGGG